MDVTIGEGDDEAWAYRRDPSFRLPWKDAVLRTAVGGTLFDAKNRAYVPGYPNGMYEKYDIPRRSIYLPVIRSALYDVLQAFDFADPSFPAGERAVIEAYRRIDPT